MSPRHPSPEGAALTTKLHSHRQDKYPRIQILTIEDLLAGKQVAHPRLLDATFKKAPKARKAAKEQMPLGGEIEEPF